jgi:hypothetical protein
VDKAFLDAMASGYALDEPALVLGAPMHAGEVDAATKVRVGLSMLNRHGLVAGATGTGKTKTLQLMAGQLSKAGVPVFVADVKGDLTGLAAPGDATNPKIQARSASIGLTFEPSGHPLELLSLSGDLGVPVRATVTSFGPLLLGKVLDLNQTQTSILSLVFQYCDDQRLPLLDLEDLKTTLRYLASEEGKPVIEAYGGMSSASLGVILRSIVTLEQQGAGRFFGEPEFDIDDLLRTSPEGAGIVSILELSDVMDQPRLFSTFMLWLLAELYEGLPEAGDLPKPKLVFFFDEAHLLFADSSDALLEQIERTARLIRSKGVGVYFVTQAPTDVPPSVLGQLGNRIQHALRAFTPEDADALRKTARTFPMTDFYDVEKTITSLGIGEALVTVLSPSGVPTPLAATRLVPPDSLMAPVPPETAKAIVSASPLEARYRVAVDRESAHEVISARLGAAGAAAAAAASAAGAAKTAAAEAKARAARTKELERLRREAEREAKAQAREAARAARERQRLVEGAMRSGTRLATSRAGQDLIRGVFGTLFGGGRRR